MEFRFTDPATDFSDGIKVIESYHQDFLKRGSELLGLAEEIISRGMNENLANRCVDMHCHYFHAGRLHHLDEEQGLFPLLENQSRLFDGMIDLLIQDHEEIEEDWEQLAGMLADPESITDTSLLRDLVKAFEKTQREHVIREDKDLLPKLEELLTIEQRQQAGEVMAKLRKLTS